MSHTFTRQELFDLVWAEPMRTLAGRFELSDVGLAKACKKADIPRPPRGYWAKLAAGKRVVRSSLPERGPGMSDEIEVGKGPYYDYRHYSDGEILASNPQPPVFEDEIEEVAERVKAMIPRVTVPRFPERAHHHIRRLLEADEERRTKYLASRYPLSWDKPLFDEPFEQRRLRVLNAIMTALEKAGMKPTIRDKDGRGLCVHVNDTTVGYTLDSTSQKPAAYPYQRSAIATRGSSTKLKCEIASCKASSGVRTSWEDTDKTKLEAHLTEIVVELVVSGERQYRAGQRRHYELLLKRKADVIEEIRKRKEEAERKERERLAALERAGVKRLLGEATALRRAADIRAYVGQLEELCADGDVDVSGDQLADWRRWALAQADRIDPVQSRRFLDGIHDLNDDQGDDDDENDDTD